MTAPTGYPKLIVRAVGDPNSRTLRADLQDVFVSEWSESSNGIMYGTAENRGPIPLILTLFTSPDNGVARPYAPVPVTVLGSATADLTVQPKGVVEFQLPGTYAVAASGRLSINPDEQPIDAATVLLDDGTNTATLEFDADSSVTAGNIAVAIGATTGATVQNFVDAVNAASPLNTEAYVNPDRKSSADLYQTGTGAAGNNAITIAGDTYGALTAEGFAGGADGGVRHGFHLLRVRSTVGQSFGMVRLGAWEGRMGLRSGPRYVTL